MKDAYNEILKAYKTALAGVGVSAYAIIAPPDSGTKYVVYSIVSATSDDSMTCSGQEVVMQVSIFDQTQNGKVSGINAIADLVYQSIYGAPNQTLTLTGMQNVTTNMALDRVVQLPLGQDIQLQRIIHFKHKISFNS